MSPITHARNRPEVPSPSVPGDDLLGAAREVSAALGVASLLLQQMLDHSPPTVAHSLRVARLAALVAAHLPPGSDGVTLAAGWPSAVYAAALAHDTGKLRVPLSILTAPRRLTPGERAIIERHPDDGADLIRAASAASAASTGVSRLLVEAACGHHERWDGGGYPNHLTECATPLIARVVGLADAWDAMREDRPYRAGLSHDAAVQEVVRGAGRQFDPELVAVVLDQRLLTD